MSSSGVLAQLVHMIPDPVGERVLPWKRAAFRAAGIAPASKEGTRLFIGPVNSAGQGYAWARAAEGSGDVFATDFMYRGPDDVFGYRADQVVDTVYFRTNARWQRAQRRAVARRYTHVLVESGRQIFGTSVPVAEQISELQRRGLRVALLWHGSDIRRPSRHAQREVDSPFLPGGYRETERLEEIAAANHALLASTDLPVFVSTPDLLAEVPDAVWLPVVVDPDAWTSDLEPITSGKPPVVVHAPSNAGLKGSDRIAPVLRRLHSEGIIEYREISGVRASDMPGVYGAADIVLDQFSLGIYGVAACEAMAAGRIVISHVSEDVRDSVRRLTGDALPIIQSRIDELESVLRSIIADPTAARAVADEGPEFVRRNHDGTRAAEALRTFLES
ncbi:glycosyltransferase [Microbacterium sp.]|uniref:glycosyltransferase n=1 Tax=Microbacterium sp. TaxID=51671 RepID=UPI0035614387